VKFLKTSPVVYVLWNGWRRTRYNLRSREIFLFGEEISSKNLLFQAVPGGNFTGGRERKFMREDKVEQKYISILKKWMVTKE